MKFFRLAAVALASAMAAGGAAALDLTITGYASDDNSVQVKLDPSPNTFSSWTGSGGVSELRLSLSGAGVPPGIISGYTYRAEVGPGTFTGNPVETFEVGRTYSEYNVVDFSAPKANLLAKLWTLHGNDVQTDSSSDNKSRDAAAFQLAAWEVIYDSTPYEVKNSGGANPPAIFSAIGSSNATKTQADQWLTQALGYAGPVSYKVQDLVSTSSTRTVEINDHQVVQPAAGHTDFLLATQIPVPEPSGMLLMATGVLALTFVGRRRLRDHV
jgi:hypothetical protein